MKKNVIFRPLLPIAVALVAGCNGSDDPGVTDTRYTVTGQLNDTGIALCAAPEANQQPCPQDLLPGQDAEFGRDSAAAGLTKQGAGAAGFDWTKLGASGDALTIQNQAWVDGGSEEAGTHWSCVRDNVTGLVWEIKETDPSHPRYTGHTYRWWLDGNEYNGDFPDQSTSGTCTLDKCDTQTYVNWLNQNALCGFSDWRMPSVAELSSITMLANVIPAVDTAYFPDVEEPRFFTNQSLARDPSRAWYVYFSDGSVSFTNKGDASHVRLVRGDQP
jgi:hypothetical protein